MPENPLNGTGRFLALPLLNKWVDHWFARASGRCDVAVVQPAKPTPLTFSATESLFFVWTYEDKPAVVRRCVECGVPENDAKRLLVCGRCRVATYCSKKCQIAQWPNHKSLCSQPSQ